MESSDLAKRMKRYELSSKQFLTRRTPVIIRLDGKAFHTLTRGFDKPFDKVLHRAMVNTMHKLCEEIQGCVFGYTQSDEITLVLIDYERLESDAWFDYNVQKLASVSASLATRLFIYNLNESANMAWAEGAKADDLLKYFQSCLKVAFDSRCFNVPVNDVCNNLIWRQQDAIRNSIQMLGQANFSHKELQHKSCKKIKEMLLDKSIDWEKVETCFKRGTSCYKVDGKWFVDWETPVFQDNREFVEEWIDV